MLPLSRYRLRFKSSGEAKGRAYSGSAWRGAFGHALKKAVCVTHLSACPPCLLYRSCPYPYIFDTPPPVTALKMRKYTAIPHPFLLEVPACQDGHHEVGLTVIGRGNNYLPYLVHALQRAAGEGLGRDRASLKLIDVWQAHPVETESWLKIYQPGEVLEPFAASIPAVPSVPPTLRLCLKTPVRLRREERLVTPDLFRFADLFGALLRRASMLSYFHSDSALETDFAVLIEKARRVELAEKKIHWREWTRYSSRQKTEMQMGGLVGEIALKLEADSPFWPYLWIGQWIHVGKGTSMGLGHYTIETASLPNCEPAEVQ